MTEMSKTSSFGWGILVSFLAGIVASLIAVPFLSWVIMILMYYYYLRPKGCNVWYYLFGFLFIFILLMSVLAALLMQFLGRTP